jgi:hypothetical protein
MGLTSTRNIPTATKIVYFCGEILARDSIEFQKRWDTGNKQYINSIILNYI